MAAALGWELDVPDVNEWLGGTCDLTLMAHDGAAGATSVSVYCDKKKVWFDEAAVREKHGVTPGQLVDYLALVGDASDERCEWARPNLHALRSFCREKFGWDEAKLRDYFENGGE